MGCTGSPLKKTLNAVSTQHLCEENNAIVIKTIRFRDTDNLETYQLLLLVDSSDVKLNMQKELREVVNKVRTFSDIDDCLQYIQEVKNNQKVILVIMSVDGLDRQLLDRVHNLKQISDCYISCTEKQASCEWTKSYQKVRHVSKSPDELLKQLTIDQRRRERTDDNLGITIYNRSDTDNTSVKEQRDSRNAMFMYFQVLIDILLKLDDNVQETSAKQDLIDYFKRVYDGNQSVLQIIEEFEQQYEPNKAIWWYTRPEFLYSTLNKALRESDYEILSALRFYISDLQQQLIQEHQRFLNSYSSDATRDHIFRVYRGQAIAVDEMELIRQSTGEFISMQSFLSTTTDRDIAALFADSIIPITDEITRILFEFNIDTNVTQTKSYATIRHLSYFRNEEEVLLMLGSIFKIERVEFDDTAQVWSAILSLCSEDSYELKDLMEQVKKDTSAGVASPGWLLYRQGEFEKATTYFQHLLDEPSLSDFDRACSYRGLGGIAIRQLAYDQALSYHQKELELRIKVGKNEELAKTYMAIGQAYYWRQEYDLALETTQKALSLLPENHLERADIYGIIASVYKDKKEWNLSLDYFNKELELKQRLLPENYADIGLTLCNIGALYFDQDQTQTALEYFLKARTIFVKSLPPRHPRIITIEQYILLAQNQ